MTDFNRRGRRASSVETGKIKLSLFKKLDCQIRDISPGGARLLLPEGTDLPAEFTLRLPQSKRPRTCVRRWQSGQEYGVEFLLD